MLSALRTLALAAVLLVSTAVSMIAGAALDDRPAGKHGADAPYYVPDARFLRVISLGYENVTADLLWFRTISYFGEHYRSDHVYPWLARMCDIVTDLDPRAAHVYRFAGLILPWEVGDADEGIRLLEKGVRVFPQEWRFHYWLGFNYFYFKNDIGKAVEHLGRAARIPGAHPAAAHLAALLHSNTYGPENTLQYLLEMESQAESGEMRSVIQQQIAEVRMAAALDELNEAVRRYRAQHGRLPPDVDTLVSAGLVREVPLDAFGGRLMIDPASGEVHSSTGRVPMQMHHSRMREQQLKRRQGQ